MEIRKDPVKELACGHCFHAKCLNQWLEQKFVCPNCKVVSCTTTRNCRMCTLKTIFLHILRFCRYYFCVWNTQFFFSFRNFHNIYLRVVPLLLSHHQAPARKPPWRASSSSSSLAASLRSSGLQSLLGGSSTTDKSSSSDVRPGPRSHGRGGGVRVVSEVLHNLTLSSRFVLFRAHCFPFMPFYFLLVSAPFLILQWCGI